MPVLLLPELLDALARLLLEEEEVDDDDDGPLASTSKSLLVLRLNTKHARSIADAIVKEDNLVFMFAELN